MTAILAPMLLALAQVPSANTAEPASRGTISVEPDEQQDLPPEIADVFDRAVEQSLGTADFTLLDAPGHSRFIARFHVAHDAKGLVGLHAPGGKATVNLLSLSVPLPSNKTQLHGLYLTRLTVEILRRGTTRPMWRGTAVTVQPDDTAAGDPAAIAGKLAGSLIAQYPKKLDSAISVP